MIEELEFAHILVLMAAGMIAGFACGLMGVGGGFIMVPVQIWELTSAGIEPTIATRVALGTSLAAILPTALTSCRGHACRGVVLLGPAKSISISGFFGALLGGIAVAHAPGDLLAKFFGLVVLVGAIRMVLCRRIESCRSSDALAGLNVSGLPSYSLGYVNLLQWMILAATSIPMARLGVRFSHEIARDKLIYIFTAVMLYIGLGMIGAFGWLRS